jgi:small-conductance mechanosensitive channel
VQVKVRCPVTQDPALLLERLGEAARSMSWANDTPAPEAVLLDMGDGWLHFEVRVWARGTDTSDALVTELNLAAWRAVRAPDPTPAAAQPGSAAPKPS